VCPGGFLIRGIHVVLLTEYHHVLNASCLISVIWSKATLCKNSGATVLRNRRWGGSVYVLQVFFLLFFRPSNVRQPFSGTAERIFMKLSPNDRGGEYVVWNVVPPLGESRAAAWWVAIVDALRNLRYDSFAITRGRHVIYAMTLAESPEGATGGCVIQQW